MDVETIKKNFARIRQNKGLKMEDLARNLGVTPQTIYAQMRGNPTISTLEKLAALVGCDPWELLKPEPDQDNQSNQAEQPAQAANAIRCPHCNKIILLNPTTTEQ